MRSKDGLNHSGPPTPRTIYLHLGVPGNKFEPNANAGSSWGGMCKCPDGQTYGVSDNADDCASLACIGGIAGQCNRFVGMWSTNKVTCADGDRSTACNPVPLCMIHVRTLDKRAPAFIRPSHLGNPCHSELVTSPLCPFVGVRFQVEPQLPLGLSIDGTGTIRGAATVLVLEPRTYTVTATDGGGSSAINISISIIAVPPELKYTHSLYTYTHKQKISGNQVILKGSDSFAAITECTSSPPLPTYLVLNEATCEITGTAQEMKWPPVTYIITASNSGGSTTATIQIGIKAIKPASLTLSGGNTFVLTVGGTPVTESGVVNSASGSITSYSVAPPLPDGLGFDRFTCTISGSPTQISPTKLYTFTASNTGGAVSYVQAITVLGRAPHGLTYDSSELTFSLGRSYTEWPNINLGAHLLALFIV